MFEVAELGQRLAEDEYDEAKDDLRVRLVNAQFELRQRGDFAVTIVLSGDDRLGVADVVMLFNAWLDTRDLRTHVLRAPTDEELDRPPMYRFWRRLPRAGEIAVTTGGLATEVLRPRWLGEIDDDEAAHRTDRLSRFEQALSAEGHLLVKLWLHLPPDELHRKIKAAEKDPERSWLLQPEDRELRKHRHRAMEVAERFLRRSDTASAPWHLVEATDPMHRNVTVARLVVEHLEARLAGTRPPVLHAPPPSSVHDTSGRRTVLDAVDLSASLSKSDYQERLVEAQRRLNAAHRAAREARHTTLVAFEGWDAGGKGGAIRRVTRALDPGSFYVERIAAPTEEELAHHYLWRFWRRLPPAGTVQLFDRSWYGRVLVERVEGLATDDEWLRAYGEINDFEQQLTEADTSVVKFWLHIDPDEQLRRFEARQATPYKHYKITDDDWRNRDRWGDYVAAVHDMVERTSTPSAPWYLVAANDKRWARVQVVETLAATMEAALDG